jgi:hypothetical protein
MCALAGMDWMRLERHTIADGWGCRGSVPTEMLERLAGKVRCHHVGIHHIDVPRASVLFIVFVFVVRAAVEVGRSLVFVGSAKLVHDLD